MPTKRAARAASEGKRTGSAGHRDPGKDGGGAPPVRGARAEKRDYRFEIQEKQGTVAVVGPRGVLAYPKFWIGVELAQGEVFTSCQSGLSAGPGAWVGEVANGRLVLELTLKRSSSPSGVLVRAAVRNRGSDPLAIRGIRVAHAVTSAQSTPWGPVEGWSMLRMGYSHGGAHREDADARGSSRVVFAEDRVVARSWGATAIRFGASPAGLVAGFVTGSSQMAWIDVRRDRHSVELAAVCETEGVVLLPGRAVSSEELYLGLHGDVRAGLAEYGALCGRRAGADLRPVPTGWCSERSLGPSDISDAAIAREIKVVAAQRKALPLDVMSIGPGWVRHPGDWDHPTERFPRGLGALAAEMAAAGLVPGLWIAPFTASASSRLFHDHPDWMVKDEAGRPLAWDVEGAEPREVWYGLDGSHPEVDEWIRELFAGLRRAGFRHFVLDQLFMGALRGARAEPVTRAQALRRGLEAVRKGAGDAYLVGARGPYGPAAGLLDGMRVCPDPAVPDDATAKARPPASAMQEAHQRWWAHRSIWNNHPEALLLGPAGGGTLEEERAAVAGVELSGGALFVASPLDEVPADRTAMLSGALARRRDTPGIPLDVFDRDVPRVVALPLGRGRFRVAVFNDTGAPRAFVLDLDWFGCARARIHELDGAAERPLGLARRRYLTPPVPPHGARILLVEGA